MIWLMNSAMMPVEGIYCLRQVRKEEFADFIKANKDEITSLIGYENTLEFVNELCGTKFKMSRLEAEIRHGDKLAIIRLKYRLADPGQKGKYTPGKEDYQFFLADYDSFSNMERT